MKKEIIINVENTEKRIAFLEDGALEEYYFERSDKRRLAGGIHRGKVSKVVPGIQACFVNIGLRKNGFLHVSDIVDPARAYAEVVGEELDGAEAQQSVKKKIEDLVHNRDDLLVQVIKDTIGGKGPRLTTSISLPGRYLVLVPMVPRRGVSRRIEDPSERERLRKILDSLPIPDSMGVIMRTFAQGGTKKSFLKDLRLLLYLWRRIEKRYKETEKPTRLYQEMDIVKRFLRDAMSEEIEKVVVDSKTEYKELRKFVHTSLPNCRTEIELYKEKVPIFEKHGLEKEIEKAFRRKVWLKCGGYVVIEKSEALVAIDVNTGRNIGADNPEETILATNLEAAREIARQLRLRNMGGLIVIDFIDMKTKTNRRAVYDELRRSLRRDKARTYLLPISDLGLLEMTRERDRESLGEALFGKCPYCDGTGDVKLPETISIEVQRELRRLGSDRGTANVKVYAHPTVVDRLKTEDSGAVARIAKHAKMTVELLSVNDYHLEQWKCYADASPGVRQ